MDVHQAAFNTWTLWKASCNAANPPPESGRDPDGLRLYHARWMLEEIIANTNWKQDKLNRWLGYAQALLVTYRVLTLEEVKKVNKDA